jgi:hypothetical protein
MSCSFPGLETKRRELQMADLAQRSEREIWCLSLTP